MKSSSPCLSRYLRMRSLWSPTPPLLRVEGRQGALRAKGPDFCFGEKSRNREKIKEGLTWQDGQVTNETKRDPSKIPP